MSALVLFHSPWKATEAVAGVIAPVLGARAISFERRPELAMYDLVVLGTSGLGLLDARLLAYLAGGALRGKHLALFSDLWPAPSNEAFQAAARLAAQAGGAKPTAEWLRLDAGPFGQLDDRALEAARTWAEKLALEFPPTTYPRGQAGQ